MQTHLVCECITHTKNLPCVYGVFKECPPPQGAMLGVVDHLEEEVVCGRVEVAGVEGHVSDDHTLTLGHEGLFGDDDWLLIIHQLGKDDANST